MCFHHNWEYRHSSLLIQRAIIRQIGNYINFSMLFNDQETFERVFTNKYIGAETLSDEQWRVFRGKINERVKNNCLLLLVLDRFSNFISDKSSMANRELATEILVGTFAFHDNLSSFHFLFLDILQNPKSDWEPKQALINLLASLISNFHRRKQDSPSLDQLLGVVFAHFDQLITQHEEIAETLALLLLITISTGRIKLLEPRIGRLWEQFAVELQRTDDISYLPKSVFEFFLAVLQSPLRVQFSHSLEPPRHA